MPVSYLRPALLASALHTMIVPALAQQAPQAAPDAATDSAGDSAAPADAERAIVVIGTRKQAADIQFQSSHPISVLSEEDLRHTAVHNVAEALGLLPGVNVVNTGSSFIGGVDGASRGEGMYVAIRGLNSEYNVNLINGVNVAQGQPYSRGVQLTLLPPTGLNTIVLNKASRADMDADAIGGTVDFRTPSAFDYSDRLHGSVTASGRLETRARTYGDSGLGGGLAAEISSRFGPGHTMGIYVSGYYDKRTYTNSEIRGAQSAHDDGSWGYLNASDSKGTSYPGLDPQRNAALTGFDAGVSSGKTRRFGGNASLDWHPDDTTRVYLRGTYAKALTEQDSTLAQFNGGTKAWILSPGTDRYVLTVPSVSVRNYFETNPETAILATAAFGVEKQLGDWKIAPEVFYSEGHNNRPNHIEASARINQSDKYTNGSKIPLGGQSVGYSDNYPVALYNQAIFNAFDNSASVLPARRAGQLTEQFSGQRKWGGRLDISRDFTDGGLLQSIAFGAKLQSSKRNVTSRDWTTDYVANYVGHAVTWGQLGLTNGTYAHTYPGLYDWSLPRFNKTALFNLFNKYQFANEADGSSYNSFDTCGSLYVNNFNCGTLSGRETVAAAYATATLKAGNLEIIPGLRFEHTTINNTYWVMAYSGGVEQPGAFASNRTTYNELLPSLFASWRPSSTLVARGDVWFSYTRPPFFQLGGSSTARTGDDGKTTIVQGNPNLKPIRAINVDSSVEWNFAPSGHVMLGGYYKRLTNYLYDSGTTLLNTATNDGTNQTFITRPLNGGSGNVYGLEFQVQKTFVELPGALRGFGIGANLTRQWTKVDIGNGVMRNIQNAPDVMGQARVFYALGGFSIDAIYNYTGAYLESYNYLGQPTGWDDRWVRPVKRVDLHAGYDFGNGLKADVSVANLFNNYTYWAHIGRHSLAISDIVNSGTTALASIKYSF
ncbi:MULTISPECIES: TonB-dependent receptor [unclassified Novosphingobium]|uniref:TonB-dependent receptor n=1 Tax=unclassified Novosphingobium TaxID=2644732 RepID=UPI0017DC873C|nr:MULTISPECIES: TonB-dependent receptor [unclassified Novosphingobium]MBB3358111.1 TonB-dependent receptor [Novosphingobium sp. BK256]MBB3374472.1 TonB-dependent receptor [Novosphingobium sp. BK280]MBB3378884.1 TonB-dependent receptor [Novosphingobium sp. BK258]MBB3420578.1 TonB-dependent receptor [Novosphingobium sp. BK267]MBB3448300.1 TonB-dependent receptor [Novosphingobium sp. BK352]